MNSRSSQSGWQDVLALLNQSEEDLTYVRKALTIGVAIAGAGPYGRSALRYLKKTGVQVLFFLDNNPEKQGQTIDGIKVVAPQSLAEIMPTAAVLIAARHAVQPVKKQLDGIGLRNLSFDAFFVAQNIAFVEKIRSDFLITDERSHQVFDGILMAMVSGNEAHCAQVMDTNHYFILPEFVNCGADHFVDAGAFVGDSVEKFIWANNGVFKKIYAFEPGPAQFSALNFRMDRLSREWAFGKEKYECIRLGLSDSAREISFSVDQNMLQGTNLLEEKEENEVNASVKVVSLDDFLAGRPATFIKVDIEGMEMEMLRGAKKTIQQFKPKLALSIYHEPEDLFNIHLYVRSLVPEYNIVVRHHAPTLMETVLYCWI